MIQWRFNGNLPYGDVLGGELPTNRFCGLVHPSDVHGIFGAG